MSSQFRSLLALAILTTVTSIGLAQTAAPSINIAPPPPPPAPTGAPAATPAAPAPAPSATPTTPAAPAAAAPAELPAVTQPFVATITADKVYVRSGPGTAYYEMGQLATGDLVYVMGATKGWYQILPPNGTFCMIAKEFVDADPAGTTGTVKGDYVNVRAGTALNKNRDPSAVLTVVRKGAKLKILGATDKYYEIAPPERALVYISPQFVKPSPGTEYKVPTLKLPAGATGPSVATVEAPSTLPTATVSIPQPETATPETPAPGAAAVTPGTAAVTPPVTPTPGTAAVTPEPTAPPAVVPPPAVTFNEAASARYNELNTRFQEEANKPLAQQNYEAILQDFKTLLTMENLSPSVKRGAEARITALDRLATIQRLRREQVASDTALVSQRDALRQQYEAAEQAIAAAREIGPYAAEGVLQSSTIVQGKYALVNPQTGRVLAYIDPAKADVDISGLVGKYVGIRGIPRKMEGTDLTVIQVSTATLMPMPTATPKQ